MAIGNTHKTHGEDRMCSSKNVIAEKQTHKHTENTHAHHNTPLPYQGWSKMLLYY